MVKIFLLAFLLFYSDTLSNDEIEINADQFTYDKNSTRIYATGNVEIIDKLFKLNADKVFLNNDSNVISASENVKVYNKTDGTFLRAKKIVADKSLNNAIIHDKYLYIPTSENLVKKNYIRIAAKKVERRNQYWEKLDSGIFTACDICKKEGSNKYENPLVQVKAKKIIHDKKEKIVKFYDSYLDVKGKSIFYLPYFSVASPLVKRKAGFIAPSYKQNYYFGLSADIPYYIPFNDHHDITIQPKFSQKKNPALYIEHRKNFRNGEIVTDFSGTIENQKVNITKKDKKRGHIRSHSKFDINENTYLDLKLQRVTDRNYLNTYKYKNTDILETSFKLATHRNRNFYSLESYAMQDLRVNINRANKPKIFPLFKFDLNSASQNNKINFNTKGEFVSLRRTKGLETTKFFINQNLLYPTIFNDGTVAEVGVHLNAGFYNINKYDNPANGRFEHSKNRVNAYPVFSLKLKKPYFKSSKKYVTIIEPNVMFIKSNKKAFNRFIPDENNISNFELDYFDIFNINRLSGFDRFDPQSRVDYGIKFKKKAKKDNYVSEISVGQSYQMQRQIYMQENSGISENFSDFVGNIRIRPSGLVRFSSTFSLDQEKFSLKNAYTSLMFQVDKNQLSISNIHSPVILDENGATEIEGKNQYSISYNHKISEFWSFTSSTTFDKKNEIKYNNINSKIKYEDECVGISFSWKRQYTHNPEDPTSNSFLFLFSLKEIMEGDI
jgi:LPS-assembly protein